MQQHDSYVIIWLWPTLFLKRSLFRIFCLKLSISFQHFSKFHSIVSPLIISPIIIYFSKLWVALKVLTHSLSLQNIPGCFVTIRRSQLKECWGSKRQMFKVAQNTASRRTPGEDYKTHHSRVWLYGNYWQKCKEAVW